MSPLLRNEEYDLTLSWQNFTVKVKRRDDVHESTRAWLRSFITWNKAEEVTILNNGKLNTAVLHVDGVRLCL
jgi:hypothetical protein